jgi:hypothetical protein
MIAILPVHWHTDSCLATSNKHSFYCWVRILQGVYRAVAWQCIDMSNYNLWPCLTKLQYVFTHSLNNFQCQQMYVLIFFNSFIMVFNGSLFGENGVLIIKFYDGSRYLHFPLLPFWTTSYQWQFLVFILQISLTLQTACLQMTFCI